MLSATNVLQSCNIPCQFHLVSTLICHLLTSLGGWTIIIDGLCGNLPLLSVAILPRWPTDFLLSRQFLMNLDTGGENILIKCKYLLFVGSFFKKFSIPQV